MWARSLGPGPGASTTRDEGFPEGSGGPPVRRPEPSAGMPLRPQDGARPPPVPDPLARPAGHARHGPAGSGDSVGAHRAVPAPRRRPGASRGAPGLGKHTHRHTHTRTQPAPSVVLRP